MPESVFRSSNPAVLAVWDEWTAAQDRLREFAADLKTRYGRDVYSRNSGFTGSSIVGLKPTKEDRKRGADLPEGFRLGAKEGYLCPDKRTTSGRQIAKDFAEHQARKPVYPGMPQECWGDSSSAFQSYIYSPGFTRSGDEVTCTWGCTAERLLDAKARGDQVDTSIWTHIPLSVWHAEREAAEVTA